MCQSLTFNKVAGLRPQACNFIKKETLAQEFSSFINEINNFLSKDLDSRFKLVEPQLVLTVKWKFNYIICRKIQKKNEQFDEHIYSKKRSKRFEMV